MLPGAKTLPHTALHTHTHTRTSQCLATQPHVGVLYQKFLYQALGLLRWRLLVVILFRPLNLEVLCKQERSKLKQYKSKLLNQFEYTHTYVRNVCSCTKISLKTVHCLANILDMINNRFKTKSEQPTSKPAAEVCFRFPAKTLVFFKFMCKRDKDMQTLKQTLAKKSPCKHSHI